VRKLTILEILVVTIFTFLGKYKNCAQLRLALLAIRIRDSYEFGGYVHSANLLCMGSTVRACKQSRLHKCHITCYRNQKSKTFTQNLHKELVKNYHAMLIRNLQ